MKTTLYKLLLTCLILLGGMEMSLKAVDYYFYVQLTDKNQSPYSLDNAQAFLSPRALERRMSFGVEVDSTDLPVSPNYIQQISTLGYSIHSASKWMNSLTLLVSDSASISQIESLPFVSRVQYTGKKTIVQESMKAPLKNSTFSTDYGTAEAQIKQVRGDALHQAGYTGENILIAVLDAGFNYVDQNIAFDSLRLQNRLIGAVNIVDPTVNTYLENSHGANVLSVMAGNIPGEYLGAAPNASYLLLQTEYAPTEYLYEVDLWVRGIEYADSAGADVVNSSLGYTDFYDTAMNFSYADMNGKVSRASRAATMASQKGIIVCTSAGNDGNKNWKYICSPADADGILAVGAVTSTGVASVFSSFGPTADGRIKPDICAQGTATAFIFTSGDKGTGNGTSFSSPLIAGLSACYLQYYKTKRDRLDMSEIIQNIVSSGHLYASPDAQLGYGIADFNKAMEMTTITGLQPNTNDLTITETEKGIYRINIDDMLIGIDIYSISGTLVWQGRANASNGVINLTSLPAGIYLLKAYSQHKTSNLKFQHR